MTWTFKKIAGPYEGMTGGLAWDGTGMLFTAVDESSILRFSPSRSAVTIFRRYTNRVNGISFGPDGVLYGCQETGRRVIQFLPDGSAPPAAYKLDGRYHNHPTDVTVDRKKRVWFADPYPAKPVHSMFPLLDHASVLRMLRDDGPLVPMEVIVKLDNTKCDMTFLERLELVRRIQEEMQKTPYIGCTMSATTFAPSASPKSKRPAPARVPGTTRRASDGSGSGGREPGAPPPPPLSTLR